MSTDLKKIIKLASYGFILAIGTIIALIPFLKKKEFSTDYSPEVRDAYADISSGCSGCGGDDDDDDGGGI
jgi:hypothetical protein